MNTIKIGLLGLLLLGAAAMGYGLARTHTPKTAALQQESAAAKGLSSCLASRFTGPMTRVRYLA